MIFRFGDYEVDSGRYELRCKGERVALEPKLLDVLLHLVRERDRMVSKQEFLDTVWAGVHVTESTLTRAVSLVRAAIGDSGRNPKMIETVAGRGYRWNAPVEVIEPVGAEARSAPRTSLARAALAAGAVSLALAALMVFSWPRPVGWLLALTGSARPPHEPALPAEPSIVVLPFRDLSQDGGRTYLAEGISEDLASALGRFPTLFVIARGSAASYQAADIPIEAIGRELGVRYVVQGSVRAAGDQLVVTSQLVDAGTGVQLWANRVETPIGDALRVQAQLAEEIVGVLGTRIESAEIERLRRLPTDDLDAYELYVRARAEFGGDARLAGLFFGTAIHDTAQVAGAGLLYAQQYAAPEALDTATVTKLVRNLFMLAVIPLIALLQRRSGGRSAATQRLPLRQLVPFFVAGFAALALVRTLGDLGATPFGGWLDASAWGAAIDLVSAGSTWCLGVAMAGIGLSTRLGRLRRLGLQPLAAGFAAALTVGLVSAALVLGLAQRMS